MVCKESKRLVHTDISLMFLAFSFVCTQIFDSSAEKRENNK